MAEYQDLMARQAAERRALEAEQADTLATTRRHGLEALEALRRTHADEQAAAKRSVLMQFEGLREQMRAKHAAEVEDYRAVSAKPAARPLAAWVGYDASGKTRETPPTLAEITHYSVSSRMKKADIIAAVCRAHNTLPSQLV